MTVIARRKAALFCCSEDLTKWCVNDIMVLKWKANGMRTER